MMTEKRRPETFRGDAKTALSAHSAKKSVKGSDGPVSRKVNSLIYAAGEDMINTIRTMVTLTEPVDPCLLAKAAEKPPNGSRIFPSGSRGAERNTFWNPTACPL